jgi:hypothetical protein
MLRSTLFQACSVHHNVLPCRGRDLAEEEVNFPRRSLFVVVSSVTVAGVAVVAAAATAVLWGGIAWFACGNDVLWGVWGGGGGGLRDREPPTDTTDTTDTGAAVLPMLASVSRSQSG